MGLPPEEEPPPIVVDAEEIGATWQFQAGVYVRDPTTKQLKKAVGGEVHVELFEYHWGFLPDVLLDGQDTDGSGDALFNAYARYPPAQYLLKATHNESGDTYGALIQTFDNGTWELQKVYEDV